MLVLLTLVGLVAHAPLDVRLSDDIVRLRDVARVGQGGDLAVLRLPPGMRAITVDADIMRTLVANALPGRPASLRATVTVRLIRGPGGNRTARECFRTVVDVPFGSPVEREMVERARCDGSVTKLRYDRTLRSAVARTDVPAGTMLPLLRIAPAALEVGRTVTLRTVSGPVRIDRTVTLLQPARPGSRAFVRTGDGAVFASRLAMSVPGSDR